MRKVVVVTVCLKCDHSNPNEVSFCEECGTMLPERTNETDPDQFIGTLLVGKFRVKELIGQGAMGRVYSATQEPINRKVAVKILHQHLMEDRRVARRFQREAEAASRFSHPNSIGIFDFGQTEEGSLYIAMEYIVGRDLAEIISKEAPLAPERAVRIAVQVLNALHLAHASRIIHRDLKPENIMSSDLPGHKDFVKVCDFGIAKIQQQPGAQGQESALTMFGMICGTPYYMSPEQAKGEELDGRTDLYSMGVIIYEMLTGEVPFRGSTPVEVIARHLTDPPLPPSKMRPDIRIPRALEAVVMRAMSKRREDRFKDAQDFASELENALKEAEFQADLERVLQDAQEPPQNHTPSQQLQASSMSGGPGVGLAPPRQTNAPPMAAPLSPLSQDASDILMSPRAAELSPLSRNTPIPRSNPIPAQDPPLILLDEVEDDELLQPKRSPIAVILLLVGIVGVVVGGFFAFSGPGESKKPKSVSGDTLRGGARGVVVPPKGRGQLRSLPRKLVTPRVTPKVRPQVPVRRPRRVVKVRRRSFNPALRNRFKALRNQLRAWERKHKIYPIDLNYRGRKLHKRFQQAAKRKRYAKATRHLKELIRMLGNLHSVPGWAVNNKYKRMNRKYKRIDSKMSASDRAKVDQLLFPIMNAQGQRQYATMNRLINKGFKLIDRY